MITWNFMYPLQWVRKVHKDFNFYQNCWLNEQTKIKIDLGAKAKNTIEKDINESLNTNMYEQLLQIVQKRWKLKKWAKYNEYVKD